MTGITVDVSNVEDVQEPLIISDPPPPPQDPLHEFPNGNFAGYDQRFLAMVSPRNPAAGRSGSTNHVVDTAPFLRSCCLCKRRLAPSRDIYMYRYFSIFKFIITSFFFKKLSCKSTSLDLFFFHFNFYEKILKDHIYSLTDKNIHAYCRSRNDINWLFS